MPRSTIYDVNGSGGAFVAIPATLAARRVEIIEDDIVTAQGLDYQLPDDGFVKTFDVSTAHEPIILGNIIAHGNAKGAVVGYPAQRTAGETIAADTLIKIRSKTVTATKARVTEYE